MNIVIVIVIHVDH